MTSLISYDVTNPIFYDATQVHARAKQPILADHLERNMYQAKARLWITCHHLQFNDIEAWVVCLVARVTTSSLRALKRGWYI